MEINEKSYLNLLEESFRGIKENIIRCEALGFPWEASKIFTRELNGKTISHVSLLECPILIEVQWHKAGALHGICTQIDHQGLSYVHVLPWHTGGSLRFKGHHSSFFTINFIPLPELIS